MELVVELNGLTSPGWFDELTASLPESDRISLSQVKPPPGALGASLSPKVKAHLATAAQAAGVLSCAIALYGAVSGNEDKSCRVHFDDGTTKLAMVAPCDPAHSRDVTAEFNKALAELTGSRTVVTIHPPNRP